MEALDEGEEELVVEALELAKLDTETGRERRKDGICRRGDAMFGFRIIEGNGLMGR